LQDFRERRAEDKAVELQAGSSSFPNDGVQTMHRVFGFDTVPDRGHSANRPRTFSPEIGILCRKPVGIFAF
jgi:hypothetical protein